MAIDVTEQSPDLVPGETATRQHPLSTRTEWLRPNILWAIAGGVVGYLIGHWLGNVIASGYTNVQSSGQNDVANVLGLSFGSPGLISMSPSMPSKSGDNTFLRVYGCNISRTLYSK